MPAATRSIPLPSRFRLLAPIAAGGMGEVWAAEDETLGRRVAIKVLAPQLAADRTDRARFAREARAAARVSSHANVVTIYDVGEADERPFMVMELMTGGDLGARLRAGGVHREDAIRWLADAAAGLDHGHAQGVVHRDVKPGNLLLDGAGRVAVGDFGIARMATEHTLTATGQILGTAAYLSPEQVLGESATGRSDLYALAVVAFELLTGGRPFTAGPLALQARQQVEAPPPRASDRAPELPRSIDTVFTRALAKDPAARWESCRAFVMALRLALEADRTPATRPMARPAATRRPAAGRPLPPARGRASSSWRRRALPVALVFLALGGTAAALVAVLGSGGGGSAGHARPASAGRPVARARATPTTARTTATAAPAATTSTPGTPPSTTTTPAAPSSAQLEALGHAALAQGRAAEAIPVLRRAIAATGEHTQACIHPQAACLTYAFALYDLGHALRLTGDTAGAVSALRERLLIDDQRPAVLEEIARASTGGTPTGKHGRGKKRHDHRR